MVKKVKIRWGRLLGAGLVMGLLVLVPLGSWLFRSGMDQQMLTDALSEASGMEVSFSNYSLGWSGSASLQDLHVVLEGQELLQAKTLTASFSWMSLLRRQPEVSDLRLKSPKLTLSDQILEGMRKRPDQGSGKLALDFEDAQVVYLRDGQELSLGELSGSYSEGLVEVRQRESFEGTVSWDATSRNYKVQRLPLELLGRFLETPLPTGTLDAELVHKGQTLEGSVNLESLLAQGEARVALSLEEGISGVVSSQSLNVAGHAIGESTVPFDWDGESLKLTEASIVVEPAGAIKVNGSVSAEKADLSLSREKLTLNLRGTEPPFALKAFWEGTNLVEGTLTPDPWTLKVANLNGGFLMRLGGVKGHGFDFVGSLVWMNGLQGNLSSPGGTLRGQKVGATKLSLAASASGEISAKGSSTVSKQPLTFDLKRKDQRWFVAASGKRIPVALLKPGVGGTVDLSARTAYPDGVPKFNFTYSGSHELPAISGAGTLEKDNLVFSALTLPRLSPPLNGSGRYDLTSGKLNFLGALEGQSLRSLWPAAPVGGLLYGKASLAGTASAPVPSFAGELREAKWQKMALGTVAVTLKEGRLKADLADFSLAKVEQLKPYLEGVGKISLGGIPPALDLSADFPEVKLKGHNLGRVRAQMKLQGETLVLESLQLPTATMSGTVSAKAFDLSGKLAQLDLASLPTAVKVTGLAKGDFSLKGTPKDPSGRFSGTVSDLVYEGTTLGDLPVVATYGSDGVRARTSGLVLEQLPMVAKTLPALKGTLELSVEMVEKPTLEAVLKKAEYAGTALPPVSAALAWGEDSVAIRRLTLEGKTPLTLRGNFSPESGKFALKSALEKVDMAPYLSLLPQRPPLQGVLSGQLKLSGTRSAVDLDFKGGGSAFLIAGVSVGSIPQLYLTANSSGEFMLQADGLAASAIAPLKAMYPDLRGTVNFRASRDKESPAVGLAGQLANSNLPDLSFRGNWNQGQLKLDSLKAFTEPPLVMSGQVKDGQMKVEGTLNGQSLRQLMPLGGAAPPPEVSANLSGSLSLSGPVKAPTTRLVGPVHNMVYRTSQLGSGYLSLTVDDRLQGQLDLDRPYEATLADAAPGSVTQVPMVSDILKRALKARISAVTLSGTPADPVVTPVVAGVGTAQGLGLPTEIKVPDMQDVQTQLPGVLEQQTGIKIPDLNNGGMKINIPGTGQGIKIKL